VTDIITDGWYDYDAKYKPGGSRHELPANMPAEVTAACLDYALRAHRALGCRGLSRTDIRWDDSAGRGRAGAAGNQHPARHDAHLAGPRTGGPSRHSLPGPVRLAGEDASCDR
jgi:D-alanine-D-alanine ligase